MENNKIPSKLECYYIAQRSIRDNNGDLLCEVIQCKDVRTKKDADAIGFEIVNRYNAHEELKNCLQAFVYQIETYNLKHEFPGAYMDAKNALQKVNGIPK